MHASTHTHERMVWVNLLNWLKFRDLHIHIVTLIQAIIPNKHIFSPHRESIDQYMYWSACVHAAFDVRVGVTLPIKYAKVNAAAA